MNLPVLVNRFRVLSIARQVSAKRALRVVQFVEIGAIRIDSFLQFNLLILEPCEFYCGARFSLGQFVRLCSVYLRY